MAAPVQGTDYSLGSTLSNADLATVHDSLVDTNGWLTSYYGDLNASFTLSSAYLVFFMHCGFAMVSAGLLIRHGVAAEVDAADLSFDCWVECFYSTRYTVYTGGSCCN